MSDSLYDGRDEDALRDAGRFEIIQKLSDLRRETLLTYDETIKLPKDDFIKVVDRLVAKSIEIVDKATTTIAFPEMSQSEQDKHGAGICVWDLADHYLKHVSN